METPNRTNALENVGELLREPAPSFAEALARVLAVAVELERDRALRAIAALERHHLAELQARDAEIRELEGELERFSTGD